MYILPAKKSAYTLIVQPAIDPETGESQCMVINSKGNCIVDSYGNIVNSKAGSGKTYTAGIQEAINYANNVFGGGTVFIKSGTYNIGPVPSSVDIQMPIYVPNNMKIIGENEHTVILKNPYGGFFRNSNQNIIQNIVIRNLTMYGSTNTARGGGYIINFALNAQYSTVGETLQNNVIQNVKIKNLNMYGGGNVGTGVFLIGSNGPGASLQNVILKDLYLNTLGSTRGNDGIVLPNAHFTDTWLEHVTSVNTSGAPLGIFQSFGGSIRMRGVSMETYFNYVNINSNYVSTLNIYVYDSTNWTTSSGGMSGFLDVNLILRNVRYT